MANHFNEFFTRMPLDIANEINPIDPNNVPECARNFFSNAVDVETPILSFSDFPISSQDIIDATKILQPKNSQDMNGVSMSFIKKCITVIALPLSHVFTLSIKNGFVLVQMKIAKVVPIFKSGDKQSMDNYRPISLLSNFSKIIEKIVAAKRISHLESNNLLSSFQFGFRKAHSTLHPLVKFLNKITENLNTKKHTLAIFCDLRKAFDTVDHQILL
jgi:sarcosine oxidase/L-pipecolate oxidase